MRTEQSQVFSENFKYFVGRWTNVNFSCGIVKHLGWHYNKRHYKMKPNLRGVEALPLTGAASAAGSFCSAGLLFVPRGKSSLCFPQAKEDFMRLSEKILLLRRKQGISQEELAERMDVSRQAISRWEQGSAVPDAVNILQLSKLFGVTTDYLLNDDCENEAVISDQAVCRGQGSDVVLMGLNLIIFLYQLIACFVLQRAGLSLLGTMLSVAVAVGFEWNYCRYPKDSGRAGRRYRFYVCALWLGTYFPMRLLINAVMRMWPRPVSWLVVEALILLLSLLTVLAATAVLKKRLGKE